MAAKLIVWVVIILAIVALIAGAIVASAVTAHYSRMDRQSQALVGFASFVVLAIATSVVTYAQLRPSPPHATNPGNAPANGEAPTYSARGSSAATSPSPSAATPSQGMRVSSPAALPDKIRVKCVWHRSDVSAAPFKSCGPSIYSSPYLAEVRFTFIGLSLRKWYMLRYSNNGGSWSVNLETSRGVSSAMYDSNEDNLRMSDNGQLVGDDPNSNLYADMIVNPSPGGDVPERVYLVLQSGDYANLHRTFTYHLP
jgi:hypothetical protein